MSDLPLMSVSTDNVDESDLKKPSRSHFNKITNLVIAMGLISTMFDFIIFFYFRTFGEGILQSAWFLTSVLTEIIIIFSLRTPQIFYKGPKPSKILASLSIVTVILAFIGIYHESVSEFFYFTALPLDKILICGVIVMVYFIVSEVVKLLAYRKEI